jgi:hypothetical protein
MSVSATSSVPLPPQQVANPAPRAAPAKDNDGDNDHGAPEVKASTPRGVGGNLDVKA